MLSAVPSWFFFRPTFVICLLIMIPMIIDGVMQLTTSYESTNIRRVLTGFLFGYSFMSLFLFSSITAFQFGYHLIP